MKYKDGQEAKMGDVIQYHDGSIGVVMCSIDTDEYQPSHPKSQWSYLKQGIMVESESFGLIHYIESDSDIRLLRRANDS